MKPKCPTCHTKTCDRPYWPGGEGVCGACGGAGERYRDIDGCRGYFKDCDACGGSGKGRKVEPSWASDHPGSWTACLTIAGLVESLCVVAERGDWTVASDALRRLEIDHEQQKELAG